MSCHSHLFFFVQMDFFDFFFFFMHIGLSEKISLSGWVKIGILSFVHKICQIRSTWTKCPSSYPVELYNLHTFVDVIQQMTVLLWGWPNVLVILIDQDALLFHQVNLSLVQTPENLFHLWHFVCLLEQSALIKIRQNSASQFIVWTSSAVYTNI